MKETQEILKQMGFSNPNSNVWKSDWFGYFILLETATPEDLGKFIYSRGNNIIKDAVAVNMISPNEVFAVQADHEYYANIIPDPNQRPIHIATGETAVINLPYFKKPTCKIDGCTEPMFERGLCWNHHLQM